MLLRPSTPLRAFTSRAVGKHIRGRRQWNLMDIRPESMKRGFPSPTAAASSSSSSFSFSANRGGGGGGRSSISSNNSGGGGSSGSRLTQIKQIAQQHSRVSVFVTDANDHDGIRRPKRPYLRDARAAIRATSFAVNRPPSLAAAATGGSGSTQHSRTRVAGGRGGGKDGRRNSRGKLNVGRFARKYNSS